MPSNWAKRLENLIKDVDKAADEMKKAYTKLKADLKEIKDLAKNDEEDKTGI